VDLTVMGVIGYDRISAAPEPEAAVPG